MKKIKKELVTADNIKNTIFRLPADNTTSKGKDLSIQKASIKQISILNELFNLNLAGGLELNEIISEIKRYLSELKVLSVSQDLKMHIDEAYKFDKPYKEFLRDILIQAYDARKKNGRKNRIKNAKFPYKKYLDELKVHYLPQDCKKKFKELKTLNLLMKVEI